MSYLSYEFRKIGGQLNSPVYKILKELDKAGIDFDYYQSNGIVRLIRSIEIELSKVSLLDVGIQAIENIEINNQLND